MELLIDMKGRHGIMKKPVLPSRNKKTFLNLAGKSLLKARRMKIVYIEKKLVRVGGYSLLTCPGPTCG